MRLYKITYKGSYLGGVALVYADTEEDALALLRLDPSALGALDPSVTEISLERGVLYNDNGDY